MVKTSVKLQKNRNITVGGIASIKEQYKRLRNKVNNLKNMLEKSSLIILKIQLQTFTVMIENNFEKQ